MQFKVPQFLDIEDKIFGPFTFRQFIYLAGGAGLVFVLYRLLGFWLGLIPMALVAGFALALAFYKPNNKPFIFMLEAMFKYVTQDKLYIWKNPKGKAPDKKASVVEMLRTANESSGQSDASRLTGEKLRDLAWSLDVLDLNKKPNNESPSQQSQNK